VSLPEHLKGVKEQWQIYNKIIHFSTYFVTCRATDVGEREQHSLRLPSLCLLLYSFPAPSDSCQPKCPSLVEVIIANIPKTRVARPLGRCRYPGGEKYECCREVEEWVVHATSLCGFSINNYVYVVQGSLLYSLYEECLLSEAIILMFWLTKFYMKPAARNMTSAFKDSPL
jgi:hypothetical protein